MAKELSEESKFQISIKTLITIVVAVATVISAYFGLMSSINSKFTELEGKVEEALELACNKNDLSSIHNLLKILRNPYLDRKTIIDYQAPPKPSANKYQTFCGT